MSKHLHGAEDVGDLHSEGHGDHQLGSTRRNRTWAPEQPETVTNRENCVPSSNDDVTESRMTREIQDHDNLAWKWNR